MRGDQDARQKQLWNRTEGEGFKYLNITQQSRKVLNKCNKLKAQRNNFAVMKDNVGVGEA